MLPKYFKHSNYSSFVRQVQILLGSSTCTTSTKSEKTARRAIFITSVSIPVTEMPSQKSNANLRRRKRKLTPNKNSVTQNSKSRKPPNLSGICYSPNKNSPQLTVSERSNPKRLLKICSKRREIVKLSDFQSVRVPINYPCRFKRRRTELNVRFFEFPLDS